VRALPVPRQVRLAFYGQIVGPLCAVPFGLDLTGDALTSQIPTRLRVVDTTALLLALGAGVGSWRIIRSKGSRGLVC
jgi:hypothetical protein